MGDHFPDNSHPPPTSSTSPNLSAHSGNGKLRGGGVRAVRRPISSRMGLLLERLDHRLGLVMILCMACLLSALVILGLFHDRARSALTDFIGQMEDGVRTLEQQEIVLFADLFANPSSTTEQSKSTMMTTGRNEEEEEGGTTSESGREGSNSTTEEEEKEEGWTTTESSTTTEGTSSSKMPAQVARLVRRSEQLAELEEFRQRFVNADSTIWALVLLNLLGLVVLVPSSCLFWASTTAGRQNRTCTIAYRVLLLLLALLFLAQFVLLLSLFINSAHFPSITDKLFDEYLQEMPSGNEIREKAIAPIEEQFACKVEVEHELLEKYGVQERCVPKIKDLLLSRVLVLLLLFIAFFPFLFAIFTCLWPTKLKNIGPIKRARGKVQQTIRQNQWRRTDGKKERNEQIAGRFTSGNPAVGIVEMNGTKYY